jgi:hypothetical protein
MEKALLSFHRYSPQLRDWIVVIIIGYFVSTLWTIDPSFPTNDFACYLDVAQGVDRSPAAWSPDSHSRSAWVYTPLAKAMFTQVLGHFKIYENAHAFWATLNMGAIMATFFWMGRRGWYGVLFILPVIQTAQGLWIGGNVAPILTALSLTPIGSVFSCFLKPYFILFTLCFLWVHRKEKFYWMLFGIACLLSAYSVLGLSPDQKEWLSRYRVFAPDYWYVISAFCVFAIHTLKLRLGASRPAPAQREAGLVGG